MLTDLYLITAALKMLKQLNVEKENEDGCFQN
jgi:hypothetical protein